MIDEVERNLLPMLYAYVFKLRPSTSESALMEHWLHLLRLQYNFRLRERIEAYEQTHIRGIYCDIQSRAEIQPVACSLSKGALYGCPWKTDKKTGEVKRRSVFEIQCADLVNLKKERFWYQGINANVQQQMLRQLDAAFQGFFKQGKGYPKFKRRADFRSFTYPPKDPKFNGGRVYLPGIGWMRFHQSRPFPNGFTLKSVTVRKKSDGWYLSVRLQDESVPSSPSPNDIKTAVGVDLGINKLASLSTGETIANPRFYKQRERRRRILQRRASRKVKGSKNRAQAYQYLARLENKITNQRTDYQWKIAHRLVNKFDLIVFENLNIQGMKRRCKPKQDENGKYLRNGQSAKAALNQAISDASWYSLKQKTLILSLRAGVLVHEINPRHSSQQCSQCGYVSPTNRDKEKFVCELCGHYADADVDAAVVILQRGLDELGIMLRVPEVLREFTPKKLVARQGTSLRLLSESGNLLEKPKQRASV